jgi:acyl-CoA dehydrogenase
MESIYLTPEHELLREQVARFVAREVEPHALAWEEAGMTPREVLRKLGDAGLLGLMYAEELGGAGADALTNLVFAEALSQSTFGGFIITVLVHTDMASPHLHHAGSAAQKARWMPAITAGKTITAVAITEPGAGSDVAGIRTTATRSGDGSEWILNGTKLFITNGVHAGLYFVAAKTGSGRHAMSMFAVEKGTPGFSVGRSLDKGGWLSSDTAELVFEDCRIPAANLLGEEGQGLKIALSGLEGGRIGIGAQAIGMARAAFDAALAYSKERVAFGKPIFEHQAIQFRLAEMATKIEAARQLVHHAAALKDAGRPCLKEAAMGKLMASEMAERVCSDAIQIFGGYGYVNDFPVERIYRDVRVCQIYEGTSDVQKILIGRALA